MSPRNLGGKYRCRPHPRWRKCTRQFLFREPERVKRTASEWRHRLHGDNIVDHVVCLKAEFLCHTVLSNENGEFYTYDIYIRTWTGRYVFEWDRLRDEGLPFVQAGVPSCSDDVTHRSCANF